MERRAFVWSLVLGTLASARVAASQAAPRISRIGILGVGAASEYMGPQPRSPFTIALLRGLRERGYVYGEHFVTDPRGAEGKPEHYQVLATELASLKPDVIVAAGPALPALKQATSQIPIVMAAAIDPIGEGLVQSLGHPGTNFTGLSHQFPDTTGKQLELLKELVPGSSTVAVLWDRGSRLSWQAASAVARARGWKLLSLEMRDAGEIERAFRTATAARAGALLVLTGHIAFPYAARIAELAAHNRLPAMYDLRPYVAAGGLISYGANLIEIWWQAAGFVDKLMKGAKAGELPIEQPTKFELVINRKAARLIGITIPQSLLLRADDVIQ
jgi:putative tryptophan/tyrosine transport system substrate-binding protein